MLMLAFDVLRNLTPRETKSLRWSMHRSLDREKSDDWAWYCYWGNNPRLTA